MQVEGIVLAAGLSSRMGDNKLMRIIDHMPMIERVIANMLPYCERIIVVVGHRRDELARVLKKYSQVEIIVNDDYQSGMFSSVKAGCKAIRGDRFFLIPADMPFVQTETYEALLKVAGEIVVPSVNGKAGHPILIQRRIISELDKSQAKHFRAYLEKWEKIYVNVKDAGVLVDIDTPEDYEKYERRGDIENIR